MYKGLNVKRPSGVVMWAVGLVEGLPLVATGVITFMSGAISGGFGRAPSVFWLWVFALPFLMVLKNVFFIWWAQRQLCAALRAPRVYVPGSCHPNGAGGESPVHSHGPVAQSRS